MILFVVAHPDDESFGPAGTIAKLAEKHEVTVVSLCKGNKPGSEWVSQDRTRAFHDSCRLLNAEPIIWNGNDVYLDYHETVHNLQKLCDTLKPSTIYTHNVNDLHIDHQTAAKACLVVARPTPSSTIDNLYMFETPGSSDWSFVPFQPNYYVDISDYVQAKTTALSNYSTELYASPDPRSVDGVLNLARYRGQQIGVNYAEAFQLVYARDRKNL